MQILYPVTILMGINSLFFILHHCHTSFLWKNYTGLTHLISNIVYTILASNNLIITFLINSCIKEFIRCWCCALNLWSSSIPILGIHKAILIPWISHIFHLIAFFLPFKIFNATLTYASNNSVEIITSKVSFSPRYAYLRWVRRYLTSNLGASIIDGLGGYPKT